MSIARDIAIADWDVWPTSVSTPAPLAVADFAIAINAIWLARNSVKRTRDLLGATKLSRKGWKIVLFAPALQLVQAHYYAFMVYW